jgi:quinoprotein glucose dehydrogenase
MRVIGGVVFCTIGLLSAGVLTMCGAPPPKSVDYPYYGGDPGAMRYSTLTQINAKNAGQLKEVWRYDLGGASTIENQPIVVNGILYGVGVNTVYALDAATGKSKWEYTLTSQIGRNPRGVTFWTDGKERRLIVAKANLMTALDADTGKPIPSFGKEGTVDLNDQLRGKASENRVGMASPAGLYKDILLTHGGVGETTPASPGDLRARLGCPERQIALDLSYNPVSRRRGL